MKLKIKLNPCFFGHNWAKWEQQSVEMGTIINGKLVNHFKTIQLRTCKDCGYMQKQDLKSQ
jgi:hypothetical protein